MGDALGGVRVLRGWRRAGRVLDSALALLPRSGGAQFTVGGTATDGASSGGGGIEGERGGRRERCVWREKRGELWGVGGREVVCRGEGER